MKKITSFIIALFSFILLSAQKKVVYFNDLLQQIPKTEYDKGLTNEYYNITKEDDSMIYNLRVKRVREGNLDSEDFENLQNNLNLKISRPIIIEYHQGLDVCNERVDTNPDISNFLKHAIKASKRKNIDFILMYKTTDGLENSMKKFNWVKDKDDYVDKFFLKIPYMCDSGIVVFPDHRYFVFKGEHNVFKLYDTAIKNK